MRKKKFALTLLEIMIVIVLIGLIGSVIAYNMKGSLDEGRAFKTKYAIEQIKDILMLEVAKGASIDVVVSNKETFLENSGLVKNAKKLLQDGWGEPFEITHTNSKIIVSSNNLKAYQARKNKKGKKGAVIIPETLEDDESDDNES